MARLLLNPHENENELKRRVGEERKKLDAMEKYDRAASERM